MGSLHGEPANVLRPQYGVYSASVYIYNILMRRTYYTLSVEIRPGWTLPNERSLKYTKDVITGELSSKLADPTGWLIEPPHILFANLGYSTSRPDGWASAAEACAFIKKYGVVDTGNDSGEALEVGERFVVSALPFGYMQHAFRHAWRKGDAKAVWFPQGFENFNNYILPLTRAVEGFELRPSDCLTYMRFLLARDLTERRARICTNKTCPAPYFVATRGNAKFCSRDCANVVAQRNFRMRKK
jgi:hypothetical protein